MAVLRRSSPNVPNPGCKDFVGRDKDVEMLVELLTNKSNRVISIVGPPGIGKSALAKYVGNEMILHFFIVHYVNMAEFPDGELKKVLAEKMYQSLPGDKPANITFDELKSWGNRLPFLGFSHLIIMDNCDRCINNQRQEFHDAIGDIIKYSIYVKFLTTSQEETVSEHCYVHKAKPLSEEFACELLDHKVSSALSKKEKNMLAELTGGMPLALQIIGSLLSTKLNPPSPGDIITELKKNPIPTLSPPKLTRSLQLNFSISLSYNYLTIKLQKIGRYLAYFPGSFGKSDAVMLLGYISTNAAEDYFSNSLNELVTRSLIEFDESTKRYYFHRLIKEFFVLHSNDSEERIFLLAFQIHFSKELCTMTHHFILLPQQALSWLDNERHHVQYLMKTIQNPVNQFHRYYKTAVYCFTNALVHNYLRCRFSPEELIRPLRVATGILRRQLSSNDESVNLEVVYVNFVQLTNRLGSLVHIMEGKDQAVKQYLKAEDIVEKYGNLDTVQYIVFFNALLKLYESMDDDDKIKLYNARILSKLEGSKLECDIGACDYYSIGLAYSVLQKYEESVKFLEKALSYSHSIFRKVNTLLHLWGDYLALKSINESKISEIRDKLVNSMSSLMNQTSSLVYDNIHVYDFYYVFLSKVSMPSESALIQDKIIDVLHELAKERDLDDVLTAYRIGLNLYRSGECNRAVKVLSHASDTFLKNVNWHFMLVHGDIVLNLRMILSESLFCSNSTSNETRTSFVSVMEFLVDKNLTRTHEPMFTDCCRYLLILCPFDYIDICFYSTFRDVLAAFTYMLFSTPIDTPIFESVKPNAKDLPLEQFPPVSQSSKSKSMSNAKSTKLALRHEDNHLPSSYADGITRALKQLIHTAMQYTLIQLSLNFLSVFVRLFLLYYSVKCCCCCFPCCCCRCVTEFFSLIFVGSIFIYLSYC